MAAIFVGTLALLIFFWIKKNTGGLPVLMYHKVTDTALPDYLTITQNHFQQQLNYLKSKGYTTISLKQLADYVVKGTPLPLKPVLLTFDDGYENNYTLLYPILMRNNVKANIFLVADWIRTTSNAPDAAAETYLHIDDISKLDSNYVTFGLHTCNHKSYNDLSIPEISTDIKLCKKKLELLSISYQPCLAYTYGAYPKKDPEKRKAMYQVLQQEGILLAFRIGNRLNQLPFKNRFLIQRIDIRGNESMLSFKMALKFGKKTLP